jgi:hypothetical protein
MDEKFRAHKRKQKKIKENKRKQKKADSFLLFSGIEPFQCFIAILTRMLVSADLFSHLTGVRWPNPKIAS